MFQNENLINLNHKFNNEKPTNLKANVLSTKTTKTTSIKKNNSKKKPLTVLNENNKLEEKNKMLNLKMNAIKKDLEREKSKNVVSKEMIGNLSNHCLFLYSLLETHCKDVYDQLLLDERTEEQLEENPTQQSLSYQKEFDFKEAINDTDF